MISNSSDFLYHIFGETRDGKMSPVVVFDTTNVKITNPKTWPRPRPVSMNFQDIKDKLRGFSLMTMIESLSQPNLWILYIFTENCEIFHKMFLHGMLVSFM